MIGETHNNEGTKEKKIKKSTMKIKFTHKNIAVLLFTASKFRYTTHFSIDL